MRVDYGSTFSGVLIMEHVNNSEWIHSILVYSGVYVTGLQERMI